MLAGLSLSLPAAAVAAQPGEAVKTAPKTATWEELRRYYAFLWREFGLLTKEMGVERCDSWLIDQHGDSQAMEWLGDSPPSSRARSVLAAIAAPPVRPDPKTDDALLPVLKAALDYEKFGDPEVDWEEQRLRRQFLEFWYGPAPSRESALLALEFVTRETEEFPGSPASKSMQAAADRYFRFGEAA
jgi:hypothetical protein